MAMNLPKVSVRVGEIACQPEADQNMMCFLYFYDGYQRNVPQNTVYHIAADELECL